MRSGRPFETQFSEAELTLLAQQYLNRERIRGDVSVTLPDDDLQLSFRTTVEQLERFVKVDQLPNWLGSDVRGALRVHLSSAHNEPYAVLALAIDAEGRVTQMSVFAEPRLVARFVT